MSIPTLDSTDKAAVNVTKLCEEMQSLLDRLDCAEREIFRLQNAVAFMGSNAPYWLNHTHEEYARMVIGNPLYKKPVKYSCEYDAYEGAWFLNGPDRLFCVAEDVAALINQGRFSDAEIEDMLAETCYPL